MKQEDKKKFVGIQIKDLPNSFKAMIIGYSKGRMFLMSDDIGQINVARLKRKSFEDGNIEINKVFTFVKRMETYNKVELHGKKKVEQEEEYITIDILGKPSEKGNRRKYEETTIEDEIVRDKRTRVKIPLITMSSLSPGKHIFKLLTIREHNENQMRFMIDGRDVRSSIPRNQSWIMPERQKEITIKIVEYGRDNNHRMINIF